MPACARVRVPTWLSSTHAVDGVDAVDGLVARLHDEDPHLHYVVVDCAAARCRVVRLPWLDWQHIFTTLYAGGFAYLSIAVDASVQPLEVRLDCPPAHNRWWGWCGTATSVAQVRARIADETTRRR